MTDTQVEALKKVIRESPPHNCSTAGRECCNKECGGMWGTGCYCCHHGKFHPILDSDEHYDRTLTCVYCGHEYPPGSPAHSAKVLTDHIKVCPKHPLTKANERVVALYEALEGNMPDDCSCSVDQLQDACACGYDLARSALNRSKAYYLELM